MPHEARLDTERLALARELLREAVFQSRAKQAASSSLARVDPDAKSGNCGLGAHAAIEAQLSAKGRELVAQLWPTALAPDSAQRAESTIFAWIERQDALDRKRNHFLRDFRTANGFDRAKYTVEQLADFESGLARVNAEEDRLRAAAAEELARQSQRLLSAGEDRPLTAAAEAIARQSQHMLSAEEDPLPAAAAEKLTRQSQRLLSAEEDRLRAAAAEELARQS